MPVIACNCDCELLQPTSRHTKEANRLKIDNGTVVSAIRALRQVTEEIDSTTADTKFIKMRCEMAYKALYKAYETAEPEETVLQRFAMLQTSNPYVYAALFRLGDYFGCSPIRILANPELYFEAFSKFLPRDTAAD